MEESRMKCTYCTRQAVDSLPGGVINLCESCSKAFREGFEKGRVYESADRRRRGRERR